MPKLSVIVPVYNEQYNIAEVVRRVAALPIDTEIIIVDDGSSDGTQEVIERQILPRHSNVKFIAHPVNQGKGAAIRTGIREVEGDIVVVQDADFEYRPEEIPGLLVPILEGKTDVVYGSRFGTVDRRRLVGRWLSNRLLGRGHEIQYLHHFLGIQLLNLLANTLYNAHVTDLATCYKVIRTPVLRDITLRCTGFEFCPEVTAKLRKQGHSIVELPITYHPRSKREGKKLNWKHGFEAVWTLIKYRFVD